MNRYLGMIAMLMLTTAGWTQWTEPVPYINQPGSFMKCPWISADGLRLYGSTSSYLYWVPVHDGEQEPWRMLPAHLNSTPTQRSPCESPNGDTLYFISAPREDAEGYGDLDVYYSILSDTGWGTVFNAGPNVNSPEREWSVSISRDGTLLVVSSYRLAGYGSHDLYYHEMQTDGTWGEAVNFGPNINHTLYDENGSLSPDNTRLYYFYDGPNYGDILESRKVDGIWQSATPLPFPVNSATETEMDPCMAADGRTLWFRKGIRVPIDFQIYTTTDTTVLGVEDLPPLRGQNGQGVIVTPEGSSGLQLAIESVPGTYMVSLANILGQRVIERALQFERQPGRARGYLVIGNLPVGVYFVTINTGGRPLYAKYLHLR